MAGPSLDSARGWGVDSRSRAGSARARCRIDLLDGRPPCYVCDRRNNRIQVFKKDGAFVKEFSLAPATLGNGSVWDLDFSRDQGQTYLYTADGENNHIWLLLRDSGKVLSMFGRSGRYAGQLHWVHNLAVDSRGNLYTTEVDNAKRVQKFVYRGLFPIGE